MRTVTRKSGMSFGALVLLAMLGCVLPAVAGGMSSKGTQGYLGVDIRDVNENQVATLKLKEARGAEVISVDHDGPACKAGLQVHDVVLQMNGTVIEGEEQFRRMLRETPAGHQVTLLVSRDGQPRTVITQLANREEVEREAWDKHYTVPEPSDESSSAYIHAGSGFLKSSPSSAGTGALKGTHTLLGSSMTVSAAYTGAKLEVMGPQLAQFFGAEGSAGLLVRSVDPNSPAAVAGIKAGDVVVKVNSTPVASGTEWLKVIHENRGKEVSVVVLREKKEQTFTLIPDGKKRSSIEPGMDMEEFFGFGDEEQEARTTLALLEPTFNQWAKQFEERAASQPWSPEMQTLVDRMQAIANDPQFERQMEEARKQIHAAVEAARQQLDQFSCQHRMN